MFKPIAVHAAVKKALINGATVVSSADQSPKSDEQVQAEADGFDVTVVDGPTWASMTKAEFQAYDVLVIGDPDCSVIDSSVMSNLAAWTSAVMDSGGNRFTVGSDPVLHSGRDSTSNRNHIIEDGIAFAGATAGATGVYVDTTCEASSNNTDILNALSVGGTGWTVEEPACAGNIGIVASVSGFVTTDADLSDWFCSSHADYPTWAGDWVPFAISADAPTQDYCANDIETALQVCGEPYILLAGGGATITSDIKLTPESANGPQATDHTVTATVLKGGDPESDKTVSFTISVGPNAGKTGSGVTDGAGQTTFTYHDDGGLGTDTIVGSFTDDNGNVQQSTATMEWTMPGGGDTTPPSCFFEKIKHATHDQLQIGWEDNGSGLASVDVTSNANDNVVVESFTPGATHVVHVWATKTDARTPSTLDVEATDVDGNVASCYVAFFDVKRHHTQTVTGVARSVHFLNIVNYGLPGLTYTVNGVGHTISLRPAQDKVIDARKAFKLPSNTFSVSSTACSGTADVVLFDGNTTRPGPGGASVNRPTATRPQWCTSSAE